MMSMDKALREAVRRLGGLRAASRALGIAYQAIQHWERVPPVRVLEIERLSGVSRHELRPDIYPDTPIGYTTFVVEPKAKPKKKL